MTSATPRDFQATWSYSLGSTGTWDFVRVGPGLSGLKHDEEMLVAAERPFFVTGTQRNNLYGLLKSHEDEWTEVTGARDLPLVDLTGLLDPPTRIDIGGLGRPTPTEGIKIVAGGRTWTVASTSASFVAMHDALVGLVPP